MAEAWVESARSWQAFYQLTGGSAATLAGLMFISVTFGAGLMRKDNSEMARAFTSPLFIHFAHVLFVACLMCVPALSPSLFGALLFLLAAARAASLLGIFRQLMQAHRTANDLELSDWVLNLALPLVAFAAQVCVGAGFILHAPWAFDGLAAVVLLLLFTGLVGSWELLVWLVTMLSDASPPGRSGRP